MGSSQSSEVAPPPTSPPHFQQTEVSPSFASQNPTPTDSDTTSQKDPPSNPETKRTKNKNLTGFALVQHKCRKHKRSYDKCYHQWYRSSFLGVQLTPTSSSPNNDHHDHPNTPNDTAQNAAAAPSRDDCDDLFDKYRRCIYKKLQKEREKQGLGVETLKKGSALREFREEEGLDNDE